ncbi:MAG: hypothetical protein GY749_13815 [Desulfobacteraceae bacterium]|nr:hypothetical protein [Desulfobacteraceae bacterium]
MITDNLLFKIFCRQAEKIGAEKDLTDDEIYRIIKVFKQAVSDPFMDEHQIYPRLTREESGQK